MRECAHKRQKIRAYIYMYILFIRRLSHETIDLLPTASTIRQIPKVHDIIRSAQYCDDNNNVSQIDKKKENVIFFLNSSIKLKTKPIAYRQCETSRGLLTFPAVCYCRAYI